MTWQPRNLAAPEYDQPSKPPAVGGMVYLRKRHLLTGPPEAAKTMIACKLGLEHMRAGFGSFALLDFELDEPTTRRMLADLGFTLEEIAAVYYVQPDGPPTAEDIDRIEAAGVTFVIIDAAAGAFAVSDLDDNKRLDVERFAQGWIRPFFDRGITTFQIDHVVKDADNRGRWAIGAGRKLEQADVHLGLEAVTQLSRGGKGLIRVRTHKDRPGHLKRPLAAEIELHSDPETHGITWTIREPPATSEGDWKPTVLMDGVLDFLSKHPDGASRNEIEKSVRGKSTEHKRQALDELIASGQVVEWIGLRNARMVKLRTSPDLASTSPGEVPSDLAHLAYPLQGGEVAGEDGDGADEDLGAGEDEDEIERLLTVHADIAEGRIR